MAVEHICPNCGNIGAPKWLMRGSTRMEIIIWVVLFFPGPFYSFWRRLGAERKCNFCGYVGMLPLTTLEGHELKQKIQTGEFTPPYEDKASVEMLMRSNEIAEGSSFKGSIVQRDIRQELAELKRNKDK